MITDFIQEVLGFNPRSVYEWVFALIVIAIAIFLYVKGYNKNILNKLTLKFVVEAEIKLGSGTGKYKYNEAFTNIYNSLPFIVKLFVNEDELKNLIETNVKELTKFLESGGNLSDYTFKSTTDNSAKH